MKNTTDNLQNGIYIVYRLLRRDGIKITFCQKEFVLIAATSARTNIDS